MKTEVTESGRFERTLTIWIGSEELAAAKKKAAVKISSNMKIKGFRPGKAPLAVVERAAGADYVRSEAIDEAIQGVVPAAIDEAGLDPVTTPSLSEIRDDNEDGTVEIDVVVTLWPTLEALPDLGDFEIEVEPVEVTPEAIEEQIDALRNQFAELDDYEGVLSSGDFAMIDIAVTKDDKDIAAAAANDMMYEIGSQSFIEGLDEILEGASTGTTVGGDGTLPEGYTDLGGELVSLSVTIKEAKKKILPELTDEMVAEATEFETIEELHEALEKNMLAFNVHTQRRLLQDKVVQYVLNEIDLDLPSALVDAEVEARVRNLVSRLEGDNISLHDYLGIVGQNEETFIATMRDQAEHALSTRVLLESIGAIENFEVTDEDIRLHIEAMLQGQPADVDQLVEAWKSSGQIESLTSDILRDKALAKLIDSATPVDSDGNVVDLTPVVIDTPEKGTPEDESADEADDESEVVDTQDEATEQSEEEL
ncbi:MAG: trigger factor [Actinomycetota bacterium]|nr:trigger factor [Actinomycetota bacterium]